MATRGMWPHRGGRMVILAALAGWLAAVETGWAYIGPGAGITALGAVLAVVGAALFSVLGFVLWPLRMLLRRRRQRRAAAAKPQTGAGRGDDY